MAAMVEVAAERGYEDASVSRVVELAGVSRATFYEHFDGREDCFRAAYRLTSQKVRAAVEAAAEASAVGERPAAVLDVLLTGLAADPAAARLVLVEAFAAPAAVRAEHDELKCQVRQLVSRFLDQQGDSPALQIPAIALVTGISETIASRVLEGRGEELPELRDGLLRWLDAYRLPQGVRAFPQRRWSELGRFARAVRARSSGDPALLPRGRSALPAASAAGARRQRLLDATARLAAENGYAALTVAGIAAAARVPRAAFYSHFASKQEAFLAAQTHALQEAMAAAASEYSLAGPWPDRVWRAGEAFLAYVAENADYARLDFVEAYAAGPAAVQHRRQNHLAFALFLDEGYRQNAEAASLPRICSEAIAGAVYGLMRNVVLAGRTERMLSLLPAVVYTIQAPFIGAEDAAAQVVGGRPPGAR